MSLYLNFLANHLSRFLENVQLEIRRSNKMAVHFAIKVVVDFQTGRLEEVAYFRGLQKYLLFRKKQIDLTLSRSKVLVFCTIPMTRDNMIQTMIPRTEQMTADSPTRKRLEQCIQNHGKQFEHLDVIELFSFVCICLYFLLEQEV